MQLRSAGRSWEAVGKDGESIDSVAQTLGTRYCGGRMKGNKRVGGHGSIQNMRG